MKAKLILLLSLILAAPAWAQPQILPPGFTLFGKTSPDYAGEAYQYRFSLSTNGDSLFPQSGPWGSDPVFFLQGVNPALPRPPGLQTYIIPDNVYIFFPIIAAEWDNIDTYPPLPVHHLLDIVTHQMDAITELHASIDGVVLTNLFAHRAPVAVFSVFETSSDNVLSFEYGFPITGLIDPMVADGYWLMVQPLPVGLHLVNTGASQSGLNGFSFNRYFQIQIVPANHAPAADAGATRLTAISPNNVNAKVVLDGSRSSDTENDPLTYVWADGTTVIGGGMLSTNLLDLGHHEIHLVVDDGALSATDTITVEVITPCDAVAGLASQLETAPLPRKKLKPVLEELREACEAFEHAFGKKHHDRHEHFEHAVHELVEFQHEIREELRRRDAALASSLITQAQEIIDAVSQPPHHEHGDENKRE